MKEKNVVIADKTSLVFLLASTASLAQRYQVQNAINDKEDSDKKSKTLHLPKKNDENKSKRNPPDTRDRDVDNSVGKSKNYSSAAEKKRVQMSIDMCCQKWSPKV